jgi:hypothetical protein
LTLFFGMAFNATSRVISGGTGEEPLRGGVTAGEEESKVEEEGFEEVVGTAEGPALRRSSTFHWSGGTCHVARCIRCDVVPCERERRRVFSGAQNINVEETSHHAP